VVIESDLIEIRVTAKIGLSQRQCANLSDQYT